MTLCLGTKPGATGGPVPCKDTGEAPASVGVQASASSGRLAEGRRKPRGCSSGEWDTGEGGSDLARGNGASSLSEEELELEEPLASLSRCRATPSDGLSGGPWSSSGMERITRMDL
jgi:hypothetical protein